MHPPALRPKLLGVLVSVVTLLLGLSPPAAQAIALGRVQVQSSLGSPLDVNVPITLAAGERLSDRCVRAEVLSGETRVPAGLLRVGVEGEPEQRYIHLLSQVPIETSAVRITLAIGCPLLLTREFNVAIETPGAAQTPPVRLAPPTIDTVPRAVLMAASAPVAAKAAKAAAPARSRQKPQTGGARLVLEAPTIRPGRVAQRPPPIESAVEAQEVFSPELEAQITQLEQTVNELRVELESRLRARARAASAAWAASAASVAVAKVSEAPVIAPATAVAKPEAGSPEALGRMARYQDPLTWLMALAVGLLAGSAAFYGSRWRDERARRDFAFARAVQAAEAAASASALVHVSAGMAPAVHGPAALLPNEGQQHSTRPQPLPWSAAASDSVSVRVDIAASMEATQRIPPPSAMAAADPGVADELLDLQQQVDFLQILGQHDAAADLLANRLTEGGACAMVYLMLMEICQQRGDQPVFAELTRQFEQRFRTQAPDWSQSLSRGRSLDACASVIAHLQVVWADPQAALHLLQELVTRGSGPGVQNFELPAFRDLLMLYGVARDLFEAGLRSDEVDLVLPLDSQFDGG